MSRSSRSHFRINQYSLVASVRCSVGYIWGSSVACVAVLHNPCLRVVVISCLLRTCSGLEESWFSTLFGLPQTIIASPEALSSSAEARSVTASTRLLRVRSVNVVAKATRLTYPAVVGARSAWASSADRLRGLAWAAVLANLPSDLLEHLLSLEKLQDHNLGFIFVKVNFALLQFSLEFLIISVLFGYLPGS